MPEDAPNGNLRLMSYVKAVIAVLLVLTACVAVLFNITLPNYFVQLILGVLGIYFGFSALLYNQSARRKDTELIQLISAIVEEQLRRYDAARREEREVT